MSETPKCCACGKTGEDVTYAPGPYALDVNNDDENVWECEECRYRSAQDI